MKKIGLILIIVTILQSALLGQNSQDSIVTVTQDKYQSFLKIKNGLEKKEFKYSYCGRYIDQKGDTVIEGECELRIIMIYFKNKNIISIVDKKEGGEGCIYYNEKEYYFYNNELTYLLMRSDCISYTADNEKGRKHSLFEHQYYFKSNQLFKNFKREFDGFDNDLDKFLNSYNHEEIKVYPNDDYYVREGLSLRDNFLTNNMNSYKEKIEKLKN